MISIKDLENQTLSQFETLSTEQAKQQARIDALEAKLDRAILASAELGTLAQQSTEYAAKLEERLEELEARRGAPGEERDTALDRLVVQARRGARRGARGEALACALRLRA